MVETMTTTVENITNSIVDSYSRSLSGEEQINTMLDHINDQKKQYVRFAENLAHLDKLISQITWLESLNEGDEILIKGIIAMGKEADVHFRKYYAAQRRKYVSKGWFKEEFSMLKQAIELHLENVLEVEHIIFELRKDKTFLALCHSADEL